MENTGRGLWPINLQFFAQGEAPSPEKGEGPEREESPKGPQGPDLNALLAGDRTLQSQYDKLVSKALDTARSKWEAERNMTAQELARQRAGEREAELAGREAALIRRELRASAQGLLGERGLPGELIHCVSLEGESAMRTSLEQAEKAFREAVNQGVSQRLRGSAPQAAAGDLQGAQLAAVRAAAGLKP